MRNIELLIKSARRQTDNEEYSDNSGLSQDQLIQFANDAQDDLVEAIQSSWPMSFISEEIQDAVLNQEAYSLPRDVFMGSRTVMVEYSKDGSTRNYYKLSQGSIHERLSGYASEPNFYIRKNNQILLMPSPNSSGSKIRITYQKALPRLDYRCGKIGSVTTSGSSITALSLDTTVTIYRDQLLEEEFITVVDSNGLVKMRDIPISDIDETTGVVTLGSFSFVDGESIAAGDYVCRGKFSTTHSYLTDNCERYIYQYIAWKILKRDSSNDSKEQEAELASTKTQIINSFGVSEADILTVPILDTQYLEENDWI